MGIREDREFLQLHKAEREAIKENAEKQKREDFNNAVIAHEDVKMAHEAKLDRFYQYKDDVKRTLVKEALMNIYEGSMGNMTPREKVLCEHLLDQYITETTVPQLLKNMKYSKSALLMTIQEQTDVYYKKITEDAVADDIDTQTIKPEDIKDFWEGIDKSEDIGSITDLIRMRVANAEEDFVNQNQQDKENIKTILKQTANRVQNAKETNDNDYAEVVEESESRIAKNQIYKIQHEGRHNVFDRMVRNLSEVAMSNEEAKKEYLQENGRLDVDKIVESARCMYTMLEMVATLQIENVDQQYIEDTLKSIK